MRILICFLLVANLCYSNELQRLINTKKDAGENIVRLEKGKVYTLDSSLNLYDNVIIEGNDAIITQISEWHEMNERYSPLIDLTNRKNVVIRNVTIDHKINSPSNRNMTSYSILMFGSSNCIIDNVIFKNLGYNYNKESVKGTPFIIIVSQNDSEMERYLPSIHKNKKLSSIGNLIKNSKFINEDVFVSFAIRLLTTWDVHYKRESLKYKTEYNEISSCEFIGEYDWNTIELAGLGTINNTVSYNVIKGKSINNIDIDKGASFNQVCNNKITNSGLPSRHANRKDVRFAAICVHGINGYVKSYGNKVLSNLIENIENPKVKNSRYLYSSGISLMDTVETSVIDNVIQNLFEHESFGVGILLDRTNQDVIIKSNNIKNIHRGIFESLNSTKSKNVDVLNNSYDNVRNVEFRLRK